MRPPCPAGACRLRRRADSDADRRRDRCGRRRAARRHHHPCPGWLSPRPPALSAGMSAGRNAGFPAYRLPNTSGGRLAQKAVLSVSRVLGTPTSRSTGISVNQCAGMPTCRLLGCSGRLRYRLTGMLAAWQHRSSLWRVPRGAWERPLLPSVWQPPWQAGSPMRRTIGIPAHRLIGIPVYRCSASTPTRTRRCSRRFAVASRRG
jgi:hypothetical protein